MLLYDENMTDKSENICYSEGKKKKHACITYMGLELMRENNPSSVESRARDLKKRPDTQLSKSIAGGQGEVIKMINKAFGQEQ